MNKPFKRFSSNPRVKNATRVEVDGIKFRSRLEAYMHGRLKQFGIPFEFQHRIILTPKYKDADGVTVRSWNWYCDFYFPWCNELMDTKGWATEVSKIKMALVRYRIHNNDLPYNSLTIVKLKKDVDAYVLKMLKRYRD